MESSDSVEARGTKWQEQSWAHPWVRLSPVSSLSQARSCAACVYAHPAYSSSVPSPPGHTGLFSGLGVGTPVGIGTVALGIRYGMREPEKQGPLSKVAQALSNPTTSCALATGRESWAFPVAFLRGHSRSHQVNTRPRTP